MKENVVIRKNRNIVSRIIGDELVLLPIYKTSKDINCIYTLNKTASRLWEMFDGKKDLSQVKEQVLREFDTTPQEAKKEIDKFLADMEEIKAVL